MQFYYPRSFLKLLAIGFTLVALPPVFALINSAISIDQLANRSQQAVYRAALVTQSSRRLAELLTSLERSGRQMVILDDRTLLDGYMVARKRFLATVREFEALPFDSDQKQALDAVVRGEEAVFAVLSDPLAGIKQQAKAVEQFIDLGGHARTITLRSNELIDREVEAMRATAARATRIMLWQLLALIPVVLFLVIGFTILIARPIRQIDTAIRRLGGGEFEVPVEVVGPEDLQYLGERLDWMRRRLNELEEQKNRFLRHMSHELKTPLTALREGAELLSEEVVGSLSPEQREIAEILRHNSIELQKLIEDLLAFGASQSQKTAVEARPVQVRRIISRVADDHKLALRAGNLKLEVDAQDVTLTADPEKIRVLLDNLMSNAIKFSPPGGVIRVGAHATDGHLEIEVSDQGPGIAPADRERVFDPFYQGTQSSHGLVKGTGIGLSVVKEYAAAHDGVVEAVEPASGRGTCLRVRLPMRGAQA